jgi:hypothetical protein
MLTKDILFGMNILTLAGFVVMGLSLSLNRTGQNWRAVVRRPHVRGDGFGVFWAVCGERALVMVRTGCTRRGLIKGTRAPPAARTW